MEMSFAHPKLLILMGFALPLLFFLRYRLYKTKIYKYPLTGFLKASNIGTHSLKRVVVFLLRAAILIFCALLVARPQLALKLANARIEGIDIVLAIDMSKSMLLVDDLKDPRPRISVAKKEAQQFIERRVDDQIGVIVFGANSMTVAPLTLDKNMLQQVVSRLEIDEVDSSSTNLSEGLALAVARLKDSKAKSRIVVLLTDGQPTGPSQISMERAIQLAKDLEVKVYTIGVGGEYGSYLETAPGHYYKIYEQGVDFDLLNKISQSTAGKTFKATSPQELEDAYKQIDLLEKTERKTDQYFSYNDIFWPLAGTILALILLETCLKGLLWRGIW